MAGHSVAPLLAVGVVLFAAGVGVGAYVLGGAGDAPCWQVEADLESAQKTVSETFGADAEGQAAVDEIAATVQSRPDCYSPATRDSVSKMADAEPSSGGTDEAVPATASESVSEP